MKKTIVTSGTVKTRGYATALAPKQEVEQVGTRQVRRLNEAVSKPIKQAAAIKSRRWPFDQE